MTVKGKHKYSSLDGVRGLAALSVVLLHYVTAFAPFFIGYVVTRRHTPLDRLVATTPLQLPFAGNFAVCIFFVLSGFVLSLSFFKHKSNDTLVSSASRRYFRLMIPTIGSVMFAYFVLHLGLLHNHQTATITESSNWLATFWSSPAQIGEALYQGLYGAFMVPYITTYNIVLWTMHYELFGSFLVFLFLALFGKLSNRWFFYGILSIFFANDYYLGFIAGIALADVFTNYPQVAAKLNDKIVWALLPVGIVLGSWPTASIYPSLYGYLHLPLFTQLQLAVFGHTIGAAIIILAVLKLQLIARFFETKPLQYLGRISFSLYLTHFVIMGSFACILFDRLMPHFGYARSVILTIVPSITVSFVAAHFYTNYVDAPAISFSKKIGDMLMGESLLFKWWHDLKQAILAQTPSEEPILAVEPAVIEDKISE